MWFYHLKILLEILFYDQIIFTRTYLHLIHFVHVLMTFFTIFQERKCFNYFEKQYFLEKNNFLRNFDEKNSWSWRKIHKIISFKSCQNLMTFQLFYKSLSPLKIFIFIQIMRKSWILVKGTPFDFLKKWHVFIKITR